MQDVRAHVESVVSAKMVEVEGRLSKTLSGCAKKASVRDESDALKVLLAGVVMRLREEHTALVEAINAQEAMTNAPTVLLGALCGQVKAMNEKVVTFVPTRLVLGTSSWTLRQSPGLSKALPMGQTQICPSSRV